MEKSRFNIHINIAMSLKRISRLKKIKKLNKIIETTNFHQFSKIKTYSSESTFY